MNKESTLNILQETIATIDKFEGLDANHDVISFSDKDKLRIEKENLENLHRKLAKNELEVAVVGLEKAGKSMFSSRFVGEKGIFPSADERCTFTSTRLMFGEENKAVVEFYSKAEFEKKFKAMLEEVKFPGGSFETIDYSLFEQHFEGLKEKDSGTYNLHSSKTDNDIKDIILGRGKIQQLLGQPEKMFDNFKENELTKYITDKHISRAVKNVTFYSNNLKGLENIVLHDVPGFDSPTQVHLDQTRKKLQEVDAIIMVKNIKQPSLKGGEVDVLVQNSDMDGIFLYEKLFVFGSYADAVNSKEDLDRNKATLIKDLRSRLKQDNFSSSKLFTGCLDSDYEEQLARIDSHTQIDELKDSLRSYNENERRQILEKRINKAIEEVKNTFREVVDNNASEFEYSDKPKLELVTSLLDKSRAYLEDNLSRFINSEKRSISEEELFTNGILNKIETIKPNIEEAYLDKIIEEIKSTDARSIENYEELNIKARDKVMNEIKGNFIDLVVEISEQKAGEIEAGALEIFLAALDISKNHAKYEELNNNIKELVFSSTTDRRFATTGFKAIVERFTVDLIETMIGQTLGSDARRNRFNSCKTELYMLSLFSEKGMTSPAYESELVALALTQENNGRAVSGNLESYSQAIANFIKGRGGDTSYSREEVKTLALQAVNNKVSIGGLLSTLKGVTNLPTSPTDIAKVLLRKGVEHVSKGVTDSEKEANYIAELLSKVKRAESEQDVKDEIEKDLDNLVFLFRDSVVRAICLELPFISAITYFIDTLKNLVQDPERSEFRNFINDNITLIKHSEFAHLQNKASEYQIRKTTIDTMKEVLNKLG